jgi:pimeloyl-ACP methyl ester carboxylesterase
MSDMTIPFQGAEETTLYAAGLAWRVAVAGPEDGPVVLLLHGFPEYWGTWLPQIPALAGAGFRVYAADLPGYGGTDEPDSYSLDELARCVADLRIQLDQDGVHLVGHDWGGIIGHVLAAEHPHAVKSFAAVCAPHPATFAGALFRDPLQLLRSSYAALFQVPGLEFLLGHKDTIERLAAGSVTEIDDAQAMRQALSYYRTNLVPWKLGRTEAGRISQPGLVVHAARDVAIGQALMEATSEQFDDLRGFEILDSSHFVQRSATDELNASLLAFLRDVAK